MALTTDLVELLQAPQWEDPEWNEKLHCLVAEAIEGECMYRPWLESFATVTDLANGGDDDMERWLLDDVAGRYVYWMTPGTAPAAAFDGTEMRVRVLEPPAQYFSYHGQVLNSQLLAAPELELGELISLAAAEIDKKFRRLASMRILGGDVRVGLWEGRLSKMWEENGVLHLMGKQIVAAAVVGDAPRKVPGPAPEPEPGSAEADRAALTKHLEEKAAEPEPVVDETPAPVVADEEPARQKYDEPAGDLREVAEEEVVGSEDFSGVRRVPS